LRRRRRRRWSAPPSRSTPRRVKGDGEVGGAAAHPSSACTAGRATPVTAAADGDDEDAPRASCRMLALARRPPSLTHTHTQRPLPIERSCTRRTSPASCTWRARR
jgi:hypothetical protein